MHGVLCHVTYRMGLMFVYENKVKLPLCLTKYDSLKKSTA